MHMSADQPTKLERKLAKDLKKEVRREEKALHHHLKNLEKAEKARLEAEHLRAELAKIHIKELRLQEKIDELEIKVRELSDSPPILRDRL
jgi:hypothetical protein